MIYFTANPNLGLIQPDTHLFASAKARNRFLITNWNSTVAKKDEVYIMGDFCHMTGEVPENLPGLLNGRKHLILEQPEAYQVWESKFKEITKYATISYNQYKFILFPWPILEWDGFFDSKTIHLYGHSTSHEKLSGRSYNVSVELNDFKPVSAEKLINHFTVLSINNSKK